MAVGYVYILCNRKNDALYIGFTKDLAARLQEHKDQSDPNSFTARHGIDTLVHVEVYDLVVEAMRREKQLKGWKRAWKIALIEKNNPDWREPKLDWRDLA